MAQVGDTPGTVTIKMSLFSSKSTPHPTAAYWFLPSPNSCSCQLILGFISLTLWERHWSINRAGTAEFQTTPCISIFNKVSCPFVGILLHHHHWNPAPSVVLCFNHISKCFFFPSCKWKWLQYLGQADDAKWSIHMVHNLKIGYWLGCMFMLELPSQSSHYHTWNRSDLHVGGPILSRIL